MAEGLSRQLNVDIVGTSLASACTGKYPVYDKNTLSSLTVDRFKVNLYSLITFTAHLKRVN